MNQLQPISLVFPLVSITMVCQHFHIILRISHATTVESKHRESVQVPLALGEPTANIFVGNMGKREILPLKGKFIDNSQFPSVNEGV